jgi:hypothetical protein
MLRRFATGAAASSTMAHRPTGRNAAAGTPLRSQSAPLTMGVITADP